MSGSQKPRVAVIGLGSMGSGMAGSLLRAGFEVAACDVTPTRGALRRRRRARRRQPGRGGQGRRRGGQRGGQRGADRGGAVRRGRRRRDAGQGAVFVSSATMDPAVARRLAARLEATGRHYLDAPISGGAARAAEGELTILASGAAAAFATARPGARCHGGQALRARRRGRAGRGLQDDQPAAGRRAHRRRLRGDGFAAKQGLDLRKVYEVITASAGNSWMFENRVPHILDGDYTPRSAVDIFVKDLGIVQDMARSAKFPVPVAAAALQMFLMPSAPAWAGTTTPRWPGSMRRSPARSCPATKPEQTAGQPEGHRCRASPPISA